MADRTNAAIIKKHLVWGVPARFLNTIGRVHPGDTLLIYARQAPAGPDDPASPPPIFFRTYHF